MSTEDFNAKREVLEQFLVQRSEQLGRSSGLVQRQSKLQGASFAQTVILGWLGNSQATLAELAQVSARLGVEISASGLSQRMDEEAVVFLEQLLREGPQRLSSQSRLPTPLLDRFSRKLREL